MTTEDDFQKRLDECPGDWQTRLVFADWLDDHDDPRAEGYQALGVLRFRLYQLDRGTKPGFKWKLVYRGKKPKHELGDGDYQDSLIPSDWFACLCSSKLWGNEDFFPRLGNGTTDLIDDRRMIEDEVALAFARLPPERRAELLFGGE